MKRTYILIAVLTTMLTGCSKSPEAPLFEKGEMRFNATLGVPTKITGNSFDSGDKIGIYVGEWRGINKPLYQYSGNWATNVPSVYDGNHWITSPKIYWGEGKYDIIGYRPYGEAQMADDWRFCVSSDQSSAEGYDSSDFLWAKTSEVERTDVVDLQFRHLMSRIVISLVKGEKYEGDLPGNAEVFIHNTNLNAKIDLTTGSASRTSDFSTGIIKAKQTGEYEFTAIVVPQLVSRPVPLIEIVVEGISLMVDSNFNFKSGFSHDVKVVFADNPEKIKIDIGGGNIEGWN